RTSVTHPRTPTPPTSIHTLSLHDALPILGYDRKIVLQIAKRTEITLIIRDTGRYPLNSWSSCKGRKGNALALRADEGRDKLRKRSEEHTSELQSRFDLVCRLLLEQKKHEE